MVFLCPFKQQLEKDEQLPAQHQQMGKQAHLFKVRHLPLSESTVGGRKKKVHWTAVEFFGQAWSLIKWYVNFLLHQHYSQENWNILTKKKKIGDFIVE